MWVLFPQRARLPLRLISHGGWTGNSRSSMSSDYIQRILKLLLTKLWSLTFWSRHTVCPWLMMGAVEEWGTAFSSLLRVWVTPYRPDRIRFFPSVTPSNPAANWMTFERRVIRGGWRRLFDACRSIEPEKARKLASSPRCRVFIAADRRWRR